MEQAGKRLSNALEMHFDALGLPDTEAERGLFRAAFREYLAALNAAALEGGTSWITFLLSRIETLEHEVAALKEHQP